jgi:hypothetical protein
VALAVVTWSLARGAGLTLRGSPARLAAAGALAVVTAFVVWRAALAPVLADGYVRSGLEAAARRDADAAGLAFERAAALWPEQAAYAVYRAAVHRERLVRADTGEAEREDAYRQALAVLQAADDRVPDASTALALATLHRERGDGEVQPTARSDYWSRAMRQLGEARSRAPWATEALVEQAALEERLGDLAAAARTYGLLGELRPELAVGWLGSARVALAGGDVVGADAALRAGANAAGAASLDPQARAIAAERLALAQRFGDPVLGAAASQAAAMATALGGDVTGASALLDAVDKAYPRDAVTEAVRAWLAGLGG